MTKEPDSAADYILMKLLPEWEAHFRSKNSDYNDSAGFEPHRVLGKRGQFADIWRKVWKLKKALWDGEALRWEKAREICLDLIGHAFLTIEMLDRGGDQDDGEPTAPAPTGREPARDRDAYGS